MRPKLKKKELPPLPNIKIKDETKVEERKKNYHHFKYKKIKDETKVEEKKKELPPLQI